MFKYSWIVKTNDGTKIECHGDQAYIDEAGFRVFRKFGDDLYLSAFIKGHDIVYIQVVNDLTGRPDGFYILENGQTVSYETIQTYPQNT